MAERRYTEEHEWVEVDGDSGVIGISDYAQEQLGDVVFVELPNVGKILDQRDEAAVVESVKAAAEVYTPVSGEVIEVNEELNNDPSLVNSDAFGEGWFAKLRLSDPTEIESLMDEETYKTFLADLS
ncbi:MAG: glycine cleavage system protein GcvH [Alphaproteobacteria bacterium]|jgi:glycine cleavage system H protein